ncbi:MAG: zinc-dependent metalloprotease, partial [Gemmatimonadetes bacterium]|nr:zinc-dependent metalloprotease [Gemmatimonadota bacterium]NIQ58940.1 zinc-dependent metalloprotease [Gemmatimonadota bacterium]NIU79130.1 zinc-dependent metalloprotease [Gammaproteobacteria bacterium]NIX47834.1 zinc-dependent metalloprotease [Gemmatimonadota bacterium]NIY12199.1 zinc-dependent metalloprotease [Gemmatimonadota bacterium]
PRSEQERALAFLEREVFEAPRWLAHREVLDRVGQSGFEAIARWQGRVLGTLMDARRLARLAELEVVQPEDAWPLADYLAALRAGVWGEPARTARDPYRRALQRAYLEEAESLLTEEPPELSFLGPTPDISRSDVRPLLRSQLRRLAAEARSAAPRAPAGVARAHLEDVAERIDRIFDNRQSTIDNR